MNGKQFTILLILVVVLGGAGLVIYKNQNADRREGNAALGKKLLGVFPVNDVAEITVAQGSNTLRLVKKDVWRVQERNDYPANYSEISDFLIKASDLKIVQSEPVGAAQLPRLSLATGPDAGTNAALVVEFKDQAGKSLKSLLLGKKHLRKMNRPSPMGDLDDPGWPDGRYVKVGVEAKSVALISDPLANVEPKPEQWLNKDFFKIEKARSLAVTYPLATNSWKLTRDHEGGAWTLTGAQAGETLDPAKISALSNPLSSPSFNDVETARSAADLGLDKPTVITVETFDHFSYTINVGTHEHESYPLTVTVAAQLPAERVAPPEEKAEDKAKLDKEFKEQKKKLEEKLAAEKGLEKWTYLVSTWTLEPILKDRAQLMAEKHEEKHETSDAAGHEEPHENFVESVAGPGGERIHTPPAAPASQ